MRYWISCGIDQRIPILISASRGLGQYCYSLVDVTSYYMPTPFYIVKLLLALDNIFHGTESISAQSNDGAEKSILGHQMNFWQCLIVVTYRNRALFRFYWFQQI